MKKLLLLNVKMWVPGAGKRKRIASTSSTKLFSLIVSSINLSKLCLLKYYVGLIHQSFSLSNYSAIRYENLEH